MSERVRDERDLDRRHGQARERHEQLEEREARDRVEEVGEDADRRVERAGSGTPTSASTNASAKPIADRDQRQLDVLNERGLERVAPVRVQPVGAPPAVRLLALRPLAEVRDDRPAGDDDRSSQQVVPRQRADDGAGVVGDGERLRVLGDEQRERVAQRRRPRQRAGRRRSPGAARARRACAARAP